MMHFIFRGRLTHCVTCLLLPFAAVLPLDDQFTTVASWYGPGFQGKKTASGELFDQNKMTAASRTLPFGTKLTVKNLRNGRLCEVVINDRGPYVKGRGLDLSRQAARQIGMAGTAPVLCYNSAAAKHSRANDVAPGELDGVDDSTSTLKLASQIEKPVHSRRPSQAYVSARRVVRPRQDAVRYVAYEGAQRVSFERSTSRITNNYVRTYRGFSYKNIVASL